jgi:hypothetical protein
MIAVVIRGNGGRLRLWRHECGGGLMSFLCSLNFMPFLFFSNSFYLLNAITVVIPMQTSPNAYEATMTGSPPSIVIHCTILHTRKSSVHFTVLVINRFNCCYQLYPKPGLLYPSDYMPSPPIVPHTSLVPLHPAFNRVGFRHFMIQRYINIFPCCCFRFPFILSSVLCPFLLFIPSSLIYSRFQVSFLLLSCYASAILGIM